jgi:hypothetical protein
MFRPDARATSAGRLMLLALAAIALAALARSTRGWGDFGGYLDAGAAFREDRYSSDPRNTWPPFFSLLAVPLSFASALPERAVRLAWGSFTTAVFAITLARFWRRWAPETTPAWAAPAGALLAGPFIVAHVVHHQIYALVFAACAQGFIEADRGREARAGALIGLAAAAKVTPAFTLAYFLFARRCRVLAAAVAAAAACSLATVPVLGLRGAIEAHQRWLELAPTLKGTFGDRNQSLESLVYRWTLGQPPPDGASVGRLSFPAADAIGKVLAAALVLGAAAASRARRPIDAFPLLVAVSVFAAPWCWRSQMIALAPLLMATVSWLSTGQRDRLDLVVIVFFAVAALAREGEVVWPGGYAILEGAGLTAVAYQLVVGNALRRLHPAWRRGISARPCVRSMHDSATASSRT